MNENNINPAGEYKRLKDKCRDLENEVGYLRLQEEGTRARFRETINQLERKNGDFYREKMELEFKLQRAENDYSRLSAEHEELKKLSGNAQANAEELESLKRRMEGLEDDSEDTYRKLRDTESDLRLAGYRLDAAVKELEGSKGKCTALEEKLKVAEAEISQLKSAS